jgi:cobalt-zinc-cadmium efflux system membrane fusion protein
MGVIRLGSVGRHLVALIAATTICLGCRSESEQHAQHAGGENSRIASAEYKRGPHGGRLLEQERFGVELTIFESGVSPRFRAYGYHDRNPLAPGDFSLEVELTRLGGRVERYSFRPVGEFNESDGEVVEPHSFDVKVVAQHGAKSYQWSFSAPEARTTIPQVVADSSGVKVERAASRVIDLSHRVRGKVVPSEHRIAHIIPRFSGIVREGRKHIGDPVEKGEVLAIIESNQSLQPFEVRSQISGTVINGHLIVGEFVPENQWVYVVADLSEVWVDLSVPLDQVAKAKLGQRVVIDPGAGAQIVSGTVSYVAPYADERAQARIVRAVLPNKSGELLPGMFVTGDLIVDTISPPVVVRRQAVQRFRDWEVVFVRYGESYEARPVKLGMGDGEWVEVVSGLRQGEDYVTENSFLIKADILKSGASHDH